MSALSGPWYRAAGWSYLRYSNVCADLLRSVLKEPHKTKAMQRQALNFKQVPYVDGKGGIPLLADATATPTKVADTTVQGSIN